MTSQTRFHVSINVCNITSTGPWKASWNTCPNFSRPLEVKYRNVAHFCTDLKFSKISVYVRDWIHPVITEFYPVMTESLMTESYKDWNSLWMNPPWLNPLWLNPPWLNPHDWIDHDWIPPWLNSATTESIMTEWMFHYRSVTPSWWIPRGDQQRTGAYEGCIPGCAAAAIVCTGGTHQPDSWGDTLRLRSDCQWSPGIDLFHSSPLSLHPLIS